MSQNIEKPENDGVGIVTARILIMRQKDLCHARYALYLASEAEANADKRASLNRVQDALSDITNFTNCDAIASDAILNDETINLEIQPMPRDPSGTMMLAGQAAISDMGKVLTGAEIGAVWRAMWEENET